MTPAEIRARFRQIVARGIAKAEEREREHLAAIRASRVRPHRRPDNLLSHEERLERASRGGLAKSRNQRRRMRAS